MPSSNRGRTGFQYQIRSIKMKKLFFLLIVILQSISCFSQKQEIVKWTTSVVKISSTEYDLITSASIDQNWHLYSQTVSEKGITPTSFMYDDSLESFTAVGNTVESEAKVMHDSVFNKDIKCFIKTATFNQRVTIKEGTLIIKATVEFTAANNSKSLPVTEAELEFNISGAVDKVVKNGTATEMSSSLLVVDDKVGDKGLWSIFFIAFLSGFAALLTPCVFPMIPMTVSFFTKQSKTKAQGIKNAVIYGFCIIIIYLLLGTAVTGLFGADALNALATNVWFNIIFFFLLILFAVSFLGAFEIMLPNSWANKVDTQADRGGLVGIFFMALALAIVSFSCTGPIVGTLLVQAASKGGLAPVIGMLGFSMAIALPFALFAAFPGWLNSLPKSGGWLNTVKVALGFLELALAFKFLSQADLVLQAHILEREVFLAIWISIFGALAFYLFGKIRLPHDSALSNISVGRLGLGLVVTAFTIYMIPGLWGAPLNLISAFPPPQQYSESPYGVAAAKVGTFEQVNTDLPEGAHLLAPHDIVAFDDYDKGLAYARKVHKAVLIDFTGWACVNCRKMEQNVWPNPEILKILKNDVVLISLYVDDKRALEDGEVIESQLRPGKQLKYVGQKWSELQTLKYRSNSQPFYVLMDVKENVLLDPVGYTPDNKEYLQWLKNGIIKFK